MEELLRDFTLTKRDKWFTSSKWECTFNVGDDYIIGYGFTAKGAISDATYSMQYKLNRELRKSLLNRMQVSKEN